MPISNSEASMQDRIEEEISDIAFFIVSLQFKKYIKKTGLKKWLQKNATFLKNSPAKNFQKSALNS